MVLSARWLHWFLEFQMSQETNRGPLGNRASEQLFNQTPIASLSKPLKRQARYWNQKVLRPTHGLNEFFGNTALPKFHQLPQLNEKLTSSFLEYMSFIYRGRAARSYTENFFQLSWRITTCEALKLVRFSSFRLDTIPIAPKFSSLLGELQFAKPSSLCSFPAFTQTEIFQLSWGITICELHPR